MSRDPGIEGNEVLVLAKKHYKLSGNYTYRCISCDLVFLPEEEPSRYIKSKQKCVRCLVNEKAASGEFVLPSCYGLRYNSLEESCVRLCTLREACIVQAVDESSTAWSLEKKYLSPKNQKHHGGRFQYIHHVVRILRTAGRPMHSDDIAAIVAFNNDGQEVYQKDRKEWNRKIRKSCEQCEAVVCLGENFYVWVGVWNLRDGGVVSREYLRPEEKLISIEEIFRDL